MREKERKLELRRLDLEMRSYRRAGLEKNPTSGLLRAVRQVVRIPVEEVAKKIGMTDSGVFCLEAREVRGTITLRAMSQMAQAMGCKVVYGIVPEGGKTLEWLAEGRLWAEVLGVADAKKPNPVKKRAGPSFAERLVTEPRWEGEPEDLEQETED